MNSPLLPNPFSDDRVTGTDAFDPALDVPSLHQHASDTIGRAIARVTKLKQPDGEAKALVLRSIPGVGKTHVLARVCHHVKENAVFVFVPQLEEHASPLEHIRWHTLNRLFDSTRDRKPILHRVLACISHRVFLRPIDRPGLV